MTRTAETEDPRRRWLIQALTAGFFSVVLPGGRALAQVFGGSPTKLPEGQSVYRVSGEAMVNGVQATLQTRIGASDTLETGRNGELVFVVGSNAMILRGESRVVLEPEQANSLLVTGLRLLSGALLSVSRNRPMRLVTPTASVGIRGTGFYVEAEPQQTYFCTCYGAAEIAANADPQSRENVAATKHDRPLYIVADAAAGQNIRNAPFINHTDQELSLIETLVGRTPPFVFPANQYNAPRREY